MKNAKIVAELAAQFIPEFEKQFLHPYTRLAKEQIPYARLRVLFLLMKQPEPAAMSALAEELGVSRPQLTSLVDSLEEAGLVERCGDPEDRRRIRVRASQKAEQYFEEVQEKSLCELARRLSRLTEEELATLQGSLQTALGLLRKLS